MSAEADVRTRVQSFVDLLKRNPGRGFNITDPQLVIDDLTELLAATAAVPVGEATPSEPVADAIQNDLGRMPAQVGTGSLGVGEAEPPGAPAQTAGAVELATSALDRVRLRLRALGEEEAEKDVLCVLEQLAGWCGPHAVLVAARAPSGALPEPVENSLVGVGGALPEDAAAHEAVVRTLIWSFGNTPLRGEAHAALDGLVAVLGEQQRATEAATKVAGEWLALASDDTLRAEAAEAELGVLRLRAEHAEAALKTILAVSFVRQAWEIAADALAGVLVGRGADDPEAEA